MLNLLWHPWTEWGPYNINRRPQGRGIPSVAQISPHFGTKSELVGGALAACRISTWATRPILTHVNKGRECLRGRRNASSSLLGHDFMLRSNAQKCWHVGTSMFSHEHANTHKHTQSRKMGKTRLCAAQTKDWDRTQYCTLQYRLHKIIENWDFSTKILWEMFKELSNLELNWKKFNNTNYIQHTINHPSVKLTLRYQLQNWYLLMAVYNFDYKIAFKQKAFIWW